MLRFFIFMDYRPLRICLVSDAELVQAAVRLACPPPNEVVSFALTGVLDSRHGYSEHGAKIVSAATEADVVLVNWVLEQTPLLNTLCHHVRRGSRAPVIALSAGGGQEEMIAALATGVDDVVTFPIYLPLLQAKAAAHRRLVDSVRRSASKELRKKLKKLRKRAVTNVESRVKDKVEQAETGQGLNGVLEAAYAGDGRTAAEERVREAAADMATEVARASMTELAEELVSEVREELEEMQSPASSAANDGEALVVGPLRLDLKAFCFFVHGEEVELTPKEFDLLRYLMQHAGAVRSRDQILDEVWGLDFDTGTNMVDVYMHFLRKKLEAHGLKGMIQTIRGRGYRLEGTAREVPTPGPSDPQ